MKDWYQSTEMEALDRLQVTKNGLSSRQIEERQKEYGKNCQLYDRSLKAPAWRLRIKERHGRRFCYHNF